MGTKKMVIGSLLLKKYDKLLFFPIYKKNKISDRTGPWTVSSRPMGVRPPRANGGTGSIFSNLDHLGPDREPWTADRVGP
jgi:hypothetical protein